MSIQNDLSNRNSHVRVSKRYWRCADTVPPWLPWGLPQLVWLGLLFLVGALILAPRIEADVKTEATERLNGASAKFTELTADGQDISIVADASQTGKPALQAIANSTSCRTWAGQLRCPTSVDVSVIEPPDATTALVARLHRFEIDRIENSVTLSGEVPNVVEERRILGAVGQHFEIITNKLSISNELATDRYLTGTNAAIATASHLDQGHATWADGSLSVLGFASSDGAEKARVEFERAAVGSLPGNFNVGVSNASTDCDRTVEETLEGSSIRFQTGSATIVGGNEHILEALADIAGQCPGKLIIEGHTDNRGDAEMNRALSQERADSVLAALSAHGVDSGRLVATGFGEERPVTDNESAIGRAANRRIAISVQNNE